MKMHGHVFYDTQLLYLSGLRSHVDSIAQSILQPHSRGDPATKLRQGPFILIKCLQQALPDLTWLLAGIDRPPYPRFLIIADDGGGLVVVGHQTLLERVLIVVGALYQRFTRNVVGHVPLGRVEDSVIRSTRRGMDQTARYSRDEEAVIYLHFHSVHERLFSLSKHLVQSRCLGNSPRKPIQNEAGQKRL